MLPRAIESCRQTRCKTQIIVVDDGGSDGTWNWLQTQKDVLSFRQINQGQTYAVNLGVQHAQGRYIRFLDDDDFLEKGITDKQLEVADRWKAGVVYSRVDAFEQSTGIVVQARDVHQWDDFLAVQLGRENGSHFLGMLFSRNLIERTPRRPEYAFREDRMFLLEIGLLEPVAVYVPGNAGYWVRHPRQMQGNYRGFKSQAVNWQHLQLYKAILGRLDPNDSRTPARRSAACNVLWPLAHWIAREHLKEACEVVELIRELDPDFRPPESGLLGAAYRKIGFKKTEMLLLMRRRVKRLIPM
jgi:glycosyltransferase involved in cell wall biosynthesis